MFLSARQVCRFLRRRQSAGEALAILYSTSKSRPNSNLNPLLIEDFDKPEPCECKRDLTPGNARRAIDWVNRVQLDFDAIGTAVQFASHLVRVTRNARVVSLF